MKRSCIYPSLYAPLLLAVLTLSACGGTQTLQVETGRFPVPVMEKAPVRLGIHLDEELTTFVHKESIEKKGDFEVAIGSAQSDLFRNLGSGVFEAYELVDSDIAGHLDGVLHPTIAEVQFSLPSQTRSDYYEIWIRYQFKLFDREGNPVGEWTLPAYGKANKNDHGSKSVGLEEAALAACRDAMAFFSINFAREPVVAKWLAAGKPLVPAPPQPAAPPAAPAADPNAATTVAAAAAVDPAAPADAGGKDSSPAADNAPADEAGAETEPKAQGPVTNIDITGDAAGGAG